MGIKFFKKLIAVICIIAMILPISSEVLAAITKEESAKGKIRKFGIENVKTSTYLNGKEFGKFGYMLDTKKVYRIYTGEKDYETTILCLDKDGKFPETIDYISLGEASYDNLKSVNANITSEGAEKIKWLINYAIIPEDSEELKNQKINEIFKTIIKGTTDNAATVDYIKSQLTDDDLVFALQYETWKITNNLTNNAVALGSTTGNDGSWNSLNEWGKKGAYIDAIIGYYDSKLSDKNVYEKENEEATNTDTETTKPTFATGGDYDKTGEEAATIIGNKIYVGPFHINETQQNYTIDITFKDKDGNDVQLAEGTGYLIVDKAESNATKLTKTKEDLNGKDFYIRMNAGTKVRKINIKLTTDISLKSAMGTVWKDNGTTNQQPLLSILREEQPPQNTEYEKPFDYTIDKKYDVSLRKYITKISRQGDYGAQVIEVSGNESRVPNGPIENEENPQFNQYEYRHRKDPYSVEVGDIVEYTIKVTNEEQEEIRVTSITDYLPPSGLEYVESSGWIYIQSGNKAVTDVTKNTVLGFKESTTVKITCRVTEEAKGKVITNIAEITGKADENNVNISSDIDSTPGNIKLPTTEDEWQNYKGNDEYPYANKDDLSDSNYYYKGQEDDDDFEKIIVKGTIDLALRKSIETVNGKNKDRAPEVDTTPLKNGKTTATYTHPKNPVGVSQGDVVIYTIRVYNEGNEDAYASKITDYIPEELGFLPEHQLNIQNGWTAAEGAKTVKLSSIESAVNSLSQSDFTSMLKDYKEANVIVGKAEISTTKLKDTVLKAYDGKSDDLVPTSVQVACVVLDDLEPNTIIRNIAAITEYKDSQKTVITEDRDSHSDNSLTNFDENNHEDDEDFEKLITGDKKFDLALRKFITKVDKKDVTDRIPEVKYENGKITYEHTKEPVVVVKGQIVTYTIRVYNEGEVDGYVEELKDDMPEGITFLPEHETNIEYMWEMYDKNGEKTNDVSKAKTIRTPYLSKVESEKRGEDNLLKAFNKEASITEKNPDYREVKVAFEVTKSNVTDGNKVIINTAEITKDSDDDIDSTPDNDKEGEDDIDKEYLILKYFDLALLKYVSKVIVTEDGVVKETETGYDGTENPEPVVKVELNKKKLDKTEVKWVYSIKITNEGEIEGYATEITDRIPEGLAFYEEDNTEYNWKVKEEGIVTTDYLKDTLLQPGESAIVQIVLRWEKSENNLGQKINVAEISDDDNPYDLPDIDSTPNNNVDGEDDQDYAIVVLSINTGSTPVYIVLITTIMVIVSSGIYMIYKYVIRK